MAEDIVITVGGNTTDDAGAVFSPQTVTANLGDVVTFNCELILEFFSISTLMCIPPVTQGNHTATEAVFFAPCIPANEADPTRNGFQSGFRNVTKGTAGEILTVPITPEIENKTLWFFDYNTCGKGGVGVINVNDSSTETLEGFEVSSTRSYNRQYLFY